MKKLLVALLGTLSIFLLTSNQAQSISVSDFTPTLDKNISKLKTTEEKVQYLQSFSDMLDTPKYTKNKNAQLYKWIRDYCLKKLSFFEQELEEEQAKNPPQTIEATVSDNFSKSTKDLPLLPDNFWNIDERKVRKAILSRHNEERRNVWANHYTYSLDLEWTATTWSNTLAPSHKTSNLHPRKPSDWYYNYDSMLSRFSNLWIKFWTAPKRAAAFSETIWYGYYKCSKSDCTEDLITAIKKTWTNLIMKEKANNGSHYKAAVMKHFTQMWAWVTIDKENNRYYLVIHYGVNIN